MLYVPCACVCVCVCALCNTVPFKAISFKRITIVSDWNSKYCCLWKVFNFHKNRFNSKETTIAAVWEGRISFGNWKCDDVYWNALEVRKIVDFVNTIINCRLIAFELSTLICLLMVIVTSISGRIMSKS